MLPALLIPGFVTPIDFAVLPESNGAAKYAAVT
jgi:hypothetical protein